MIGVTSIRSCAGARSTTPSRAGGVVVLLDAEAVRADDRDLLEVERRPLEAARRLDAERDDRAADVREPQADSKVSGDDTVS
jgi:hypothetical protein